MSSPTTAIVYAGGPLYPGYAKKPPFDPAQLMQNLTGSFDTLIAYTLFVSPETCDISYNAEYTLVANGQYVGDKEWPAVFYMLKFQAGVRRIYFSVQGRFATLKELIAKWGTGPDSPLFQNFAALKGAFPFVDAMDLDNEDCYDKPTMITFSQMLIEMGWKVTFCPGGQDLPFYADCFAELHAAYPDDMLAIHLQSYDPGNQEFDSMVGLLAIAMRITPLQAGAFIFPGVVNANQNNGQFPGDCPAAVQQQFAAWGAMGVRGGFIYLYDSIVDWQDKNVCGEGVLTTCQAYAKSIRDGVAVAAAAEGA